MESQRIVTGQVFDLTGEERLALVRVLRVVEDNWWLDEVEQALLRRLEGAELAHLVPAA